MENPNFKCVNNCCNFEIKKYHTSTFFTKKARKKAGVFIYDPSTNKVLIVLSRNKLWGLPKGSLKLGESVNLCAIREVKEETGVDIFDNEFTSFIKVNGNSIYFYMEKPECIVHVQQSQYQEENDVNGIGWINLECLEKSVNCGHMNLNRHGNIAFQRFKNIFNN